MKKNTTAKVVKKRSSKQTKGGQIQKKAARQKLTIGLDLGDRHSRYCMLNEQGEVVREGRLATTKAGLNQVFGGMAHSRVAMEVGTHSPWVSRHLAALGHQVIVANARRVRLITQSNQKDDRLDAEQLARLARVDPKLLAPIRHRSAEAQQDLLVIRARAALVENRTALINTVRGLVKSTGERLKSCDSEQVGPELAAELSAPVRQCLAPVLEAVTSLSAQIKAYDQEIVRMEGRYPEVELLKQVYGVGAVIGLSYVLTLEDAARFPHSREVGAYLGLQPRRRDSGESHPQLGITKEGDRYLRQLLVQGAHCMLRPGAPDSDLRRFGLKLAGQKLAVAEQKAGQTGNVRKALQKGSKIAKKKAVVAVARKLAVLLHHLWVTAEVYEPLRNSQAAVAAAA